ncbi:possible thiamine pyrophosphate-requiring enzyme [Aurantimonas manganoxydans SI85-9A1]|uniref:Possible thiamine pyrophosphate-requiring enzyme n=1 Tax=Aurantimonas manganoxydans (strain ATCC BAA-1229 / DSM 21871 / SI85-9A1) TaxID=287752 RepID=Q1YKX8_AURMS|nr:thiamine pyrophosphate-binding protein [Aurantimonas manganoxydans]EAS50395.1 possible thiamine pyrophosphate-requiring enzyme [Aurantimonas manganoxydans SI85-9A1]
MTMQDLGLPGGQDVSRLIERPVEHRGNAMFGSDVVAETLRALDIPYIALNPGASFRGLHDSLVNHLGNEQPQMLLCLHEEHAVAIAQGWAKVTGKTMAVAVHSNVGLFHATMAIFNAWCDRMPMLVIGATGPVDAVKRRPWIDWIHTAKDQGAIVRDYVKWDDQPASPGAAREALVRAKWIAETLPQGPTYVNLDAGMQEEPLEAPLPPVEIGRLMPAVSYEPGEAVVREIATGLRAARRPVILVGRVSRSQEGWAQRIALAEATGARVLTDLKIGAGFPTDHPLSLAGPGVFPIPAAQAAIDEADFVLSLDWVALHGVLPAAKRPGAFIAQVSVDHHVHNGWSMDHQGLSPVDRFVPADPDALVAALCRSMELQPAGDYEPVAPPVIVVGDDPAAPLTVPDLAKQLRQAVGERPVSLLHLPLSWDGDFWPFRHPLDFLGSDGGGGLGGGPGISVGAALALRSSGRLPVSICGDGDFLMGATALWTAVHYRIPLLIVVANNRSFFNDEVHQERVARMRERPVENKWIGMQMSDPEIDLAAMARAQGALGFGPVTSRAAMDQAFAEAIAAVEAGSVAVVDVRVQPGYTPAMAGALTRESGGGEK